MGKNLNTDKPRKLMSVREIQDEYLGIDVRRLRSFLNTNIPYIKIGQRYYYQRSEVETLLTDRDNSYEFDVNACRDREVRRCRSMLKK